MPYSKQKLTEYDGLNKILSQIGNVGHNGQISRTQQPNLKDSPAKSQGLNSQKSQGLNSQISRTQRQNLKDSTAKSLGLNGQISRTHQPNL